MIDNLVKLRFPQIQHKTPQRGRDVFGIFKLADLQATGQFQSDLILLIRRQTAADAQQSLPGTVAHRRDFADFNEIRQMGGNMKVIAV